MLTESQIMELQKQYEQSTPEQIDKNTTCDDCEKASENNRYWWEKMSYEYDEWELRCDDCAYKRLHEYDDFVAPPDDDSSDSHTP